MFVEPMSRRLKAVAIPEHMVLDLILTQGSALPQYVHIPVLQVPKGSKVHSVRHDYMCRTFLFLVEHESFEEVPDGEITPVMNFGIMTETVKLDEAYGEDDPIVIGG